MFLQARATPRVTPAAPSGNVEKTHSFTARDEGTNPPWGSELSSVVAARSSPFRGRVVRIANHPSTEDPDEVVR